jgi:membrane dipeptidase
MIVDAHLDLSYNAVRGRAVDRPANDQKSDDEGIPTVGLPDLRQGGVKLVCATIFCVPAYDAKPGYLDAAQAHQQAQAQLDWYRRQEEKFGTLQFIRRPADLNDIEKNTDDKTRAILLLEGADAIRHDGDAESLFNAGMRIVGLAWRRTRFAGGTGEPGPLTDAGARLVKKLDRLGVIHDVSHLAEESFWQLMELSGGPVIASHSNCRAIVPTDRQLSDRMIRAIGQRGGVIGINFFDQFLVPPQHYGKRRATLGDVTNHIKHICDCLGDARHVGLGTDMDGGLGRLEIPVEIETSADLPRVADALASAGFSDADVAAILAGNWLGFFREKLPRS